MFHLKQITMKTKVWIAFILAAMISCNVSAQMIQGTVTNAATNQPISGVKVSIKNASDSAFTDTRGNYTITAAKGNMLVFSHNRMKTKEVMVNDETVINVSLDPLIKKMQGVTIVSDSKKTKVAIDALAAGSSGAPAHSIRLKQGHFSRQGPFNREGYATIRENNFRKAMQNPLSTFSIDVDAASYSNMRRFLNSGRKPPVDAVRIEELINYFTYDYPEPDNGHPFSISQELARCPWNKNNLLLHIGLQGKHIKTKNLPPSNLVFLIDVSGSMRPQNKLPLLKKAFKLLVNQLRKQDRIAIVVYAGSSGLILPSTPGSEKETILNALNNLEAGGSTAGGAGLKLAFKVATEQYLKEGNNRVILATDGDFNVGPSSDAEMERLIEQKRKKGIFISVLGFGTRNYQDSKMEILADKGNGNYAYIDNILEAKKVLINEFAGTLFTIAKDVKIRIEFNPAVVDSYRLVGYENRMLNDEDFDNDKKDAGELGSGHTVTALYEIIPAREKTPKHNKLKYQTARLNALAKAGDEMATVKFRYKKPVGKRSILLEEVIPYADNRPEEMSDNFQFSAAVAGFGMLLRDSDYKGTATYESVIELAREGKGEDPEGYRSEFIRLVKLAEHL
jgi:Ca-activated chloride channel homolog